MTTVSRLSDADILYYAAQNSAKKRKLKRVLSELVIMYRAPFVETINILLHLRKTKTQTNA